jgi:hypothetical protein
VAAPGPTPAAGTPLDVMTDLLGLRPATAATPPGARLGVVSGRGGPRFLAPLGRSAAATASCLAYQGLRAPRTRLNRFVVGTALRAGAARAVVSAELEADLGPDSLFAHLAATLGRSELAVAVGLGRMDELWRPTLQVFDPDGEPVAFVKVGRGPLVSTLVTTEGAALRAWMAHDDPRLVVPGVLAETTWRDQPILAVAPLPTDVRRLPPGPIGATPVRTLDPPVPDAPVDRAPWWADRAARFDDDPEIGPLLRRIADRHRHGDRAWARWHGDWVPWNLARCHLGLVAWDWEYSEPGAPVGLDEAHLAYQVAHLQEGRPIPEALALARAAAPSDWVADAHLAMLVTRAGDLARLAGHPVTDHAEVLPAVADALR